MPVPRWPLCAFLIVGSFASTLPSNSSLANADEPADEWVLTSRDSVMDAETFEEIVAAQAEQPVADAPTDGTFASVTVGDGFDVFPGELRHLGDYNIKLITSGEGSIEAYRDELQQVANEINAHNGLSVQVTAGTFAPPADWNNFSIPVGEIWVVIKLDTPCGPLNGGKLGCGGVTGSTVIDGISRWTSGIVWLSPTLSTQTWAPPGACDQPVVGHEIGHALGLSHYNDNYPAVGGVKQLMAGSTNCLSPVSYQSGDLNGVRWGAEPTPSNDSTAAAAAVCPGDSTVSASTWFATRQTLEPAHASAGPRRSVWFRYVPRVEQNGLLATISTTNDGTHDFDTVLAVYRGSTFADFVSVASDDDSGIGDLSVVSFTVDATKTYWIAVDGFGLARGETDVQFDLPPLNDDLIPLCAPARLLDTRAGRVTVDGLHQGVGPRPALSTYALPVAGRAGIPANTDSVVLNVTGYQPSASGFLTVFPCGEPVPTASNLNFFAGDVIPNAVVARIGSSQSVCFYTSVTTGLIVDVSGYFPASDALVPLDAPVRLLETRQGGAQYETIDGEHEGVGLIEANATYLLDIFGRDIGGSVPAALDAAATVVLNVTAIRPVASGFLTVFSCDSAATVPPTASNLNFVAGDVVPNLVFARVSDGGRVCFSSSQDTDLVVDVSGYFPYTDALVPLTVPERMMDTRPASTSVSTIDSQHLGVGYIAAGATYELPIAGRGSVPGNAVSVALNVTALRPGASGFITVFSCGQDRPNASNLNFKVGEVIPNFVLARLGTAGKICIYTSAATGLIVDVSGYFL